jgi:ABC-type transporter Mla subunit MlaD
MLSDIQRAARQIDGAAADLRSVTTSSGPDIKATLENVRQISERLAATSARLDSFVADNGPGITRFANQGLPEFERLLRESRAAARDIRELSRSLKEDPSQLLYQSNEHGLQVPQ